MHEASGAIADDKLKVFISYSRRDLDFADQLVAVLDWLRFRPIIDRKGIHGAEKWEERLGLLPMRRSTASACTPSAGWLLRKRAPRV
jgi:hypothetical protein